MKPRESVLEWYRVDQGRRIRRVLLAGAGVLTFGGVVMVVSFMTHQTEAVRATAATFGLSCTLAGALTTVIGMHRALREDAYLAVRTDGIVFHRGGANEELLFPWTELERVRFDAARQAIVLGRRDGSELVIEKAFAGTGKQELAARLDGLRRKASFNLLGSA